MTFLYVQHPVPGGNIFLTGTINILKLDGIKLTPPWHQSKANQEKGRGKSYSSLDKLERLALV